jgi:PPM family protein phosphatase
MSEQTESAASEGDGMRLVVRVAQLTDVGRVRSENQDFSILSSPEDEVDVGKGRLMVVADGMGGHRGGATASRMAGTIIKDEYYRDPDKDVVASLKRALEKANAKIFSESLMNPDLRGMGTTCSALVIRDGRAYFAHVGDSRIYRVRGGQISQMTDDHSLVASMVREGLLTDEEAEVHPRRNVLQRSMGVGETVEIDTAGEQEVEAGDVYILCSDGLHGLVKSDELLEVSGLPIEKAVEEFVRRALDRGAPDNVTVIVGRIEEASRQEIEKEDARAREARKAVLEALSRPTEEISMDEIEDSDEEDEDISSRPTLKLAPLGEPTAGDASADATPAPVPAPNREPDRETDDESEEAEVMEDEGGLGWVLLLVVIAAAVGVAAYLVFK